MLIKTILLFYQFTLFAVTGARSQELVVEAAGNQDLVVAAAGNEELS